MKIEAKCPKNISRHAWQKFNRKTAQRRVWKVRARETAH